MRGFKEAPIGRRASGNGTGSGSQALDGSLTTTPTPVELPRCAFTLGAERLLSGCKIVGVELWPSREVRECRLVGRATGRKGPTASSNDRCQRLDCSAALGRLPRLTLFAQSGGWQARRSPRRSTPGPDREGEQPARGRRSSAGIPHRKADSSFDDSAECEYANQAARFLIGTNVMNNPPGKGCWIGDPGTYPHLS